MRKEQQLDAVNQVASQISALRPANDSELALIAHLVGAAHSLRKAVDISPDGYSDEHALPDFRDRVMATATAIASPDASVDPRWEAGYFFNSALMRIASVNDRLGKYEGDRPDFTPEVRREVNRIKHDVEGILAGRQVGLDDALSSLSELSSVLVTIQGAADA